MRRSWRWTEAGAAVALLLAAAGGGLLVSRAIAPGRARAGSALVRDDAELLTAEQRRSIEAYHDFLLGDHGIDYRIETLRGVGDLDRYANRRFGELEIGGKAGASRGLLLVIDAEQDRVRLEVGRALEGTFPDVFVAYLERRQMEPFFRVDRVGDGILAATELLVERVVGEPESRGPAHSAAGAGSAGGGASAPAELGRGGDSRAGAGFEVAGGRSPTDAVAAYLDAMQRRNARPDLELYTRATRQFLAGRVMTDAQMDAVARAYRSCRAEPVQIGAAGERAVLGYPPADRRCAPWLLVREEGLWRLDLATASRAIRFGRDNSWRFDGGAPAAYAFAFADWSFDAHGFPRTTPGR
jgi:uncharacterized protein